MAGNGVNVGHGNISISPVLVNGFGGILQQQLNHLRPQPTITVGVNVDQRGLRNLNQQVRGASNNASGLRTAFTGAFAALSARSLLQANNNVSGLSTRLTAMTAAASAAGGALGPILGLLGGIGAAAGVAGAGIGAFAALAAPQIKAVTTATDAVTKSQEAYDLALKNGDVKGQEKALADYRDALVGLTGPQRDAAIATLNLKRAFKEQSDALAPVTLGVYTQGLGVLTRLLPVLTPLARAAGDALGHVLDRMSAGFDIALGDDGALGHFLDVVRDQLGPTIDKLATIFVNLGRTIGNVFSAAVPVMQPALDVLVHLTGALSNASGGDGLIRFFQQVRPLLIPLQAAIQSIVAALGRFIQATLPLAGPVLNAVNALADALKDLFTSDTFQNFITNVSSAITSLTPLFHALVGPIGQVLDVLSAQFAALAPQLVPLITSFAQVFSQVLVGLSPLLPAFVQLANILVGFLPILYPIIIVFRDALQPVLAAIGQALIAIMPAVTALVNAFVGLLPPIGQLIAALVPLVAQLINAFLPVITAILTAMQPLIPIFTQIAVTIAGIFVQALQQILPALIPLIPLLGQLAGAILNALLLVVQTMAPYMRQIVDAFVQMLPALGPLIVAMTQLLVAMTPLIPLMVQGMLPWLKALPIILPVVVFAFRLLAMSLTLITTLVAGAVNQFVQMGHAFAWVKDTILVPVAHAIGAAYSWLWNATLRVIFAAMGFAWHVLLVGMRWVWDTVLHPTWNAMAAVASWLYNAILRPTFGAIGAAWNALGVGLRWVYDVIIAPMFRALQFALGVLRNAFDATVNGIRTVWDKLRDIFRNPINAVIRIVNGFDTKVNDVISAVLPGSPRPLPQNLPQFASGGIIPGPVTSQRDNVLGLDRRGVPTARVEPGEFIVNRDVTARALPLLEAINAGDLPGYSLGGFVNGLKGIGSAVLPDFVGEAAKKLGDASQWVYEKGSGFFRAGAADAVQGVYKGISDPIYRLFAPGPVGGYAKGAGDLIVNKVADFIRGKEMVETAMLGTDGIAYNGGSDTRGLIIGLARMLAGGNAMQVTSTNTGGHAPGSYHYRNEAVDFSNGHGPTPQMMQFANAWVSKYGGSLAELFYTPLGYSVKNGGRTAPIAAGGHYNHVHVALSPESIARGKQGLASQRFGGGGPAGETGVVAYVNRAAAARGWGGQLGALDNIVQHESGFRVGVKNPNSSATGLFQLLHGPTGLAAETNAGLNYIAQRYGNPNNAWAFWQKHHWYDDGGYLMPGMNIAMNNTGKPEPVFTAGQWDTLASLVSGGSGGRSGPLIETAHIRTEADAAVVARQLAWLEKTEGASV